MLKDLSTDLRQYLLVTFNYWNFTVTDGALRMLVVLHFYSLGYTALEIAILFLFYEFFGVVTNLLGGWLGARVGLSRTMNAGLLLQIVSLILLAVPPQSLSVTLVMFAQALSGIAKDLNKMSAKSSIKKLVPANQPGKLYRWIAILTGSKNALKGFGFFLGGALLTILGFQKSVIAMAMVLVVVLILSLMFLNRDIGKSKAKAKFSQIFSNSKSINILSAARMFLFGSRDVWFVVALPLYLSSTFNWNHSETGGFLALWVIGYGVVQSFAPGITGMAKATDRSLAIQWSILLLLVSSLVALGIEFQWHPEITIIAGLLCFGAVFAVNSSLHSYLVVNYAREDGASMDVGFYYMANAMGRLIGTALSGWLYVEDGLSVCLWVSTLFIAMTVIISFKLPDNNH